MVQLFNLVFLIVGLISFTAAVATKQLVPNAQALGAVCLDGSPAGYYWRPATSGRSTNKWIIAIFGGGWCYDENDCYGRSKTPLGSSTLWAETSTQGGILNESPVTNPEFYDWNVAHLFYCDGASLAGNKDEPIVVNGTKLWFRGHKILEATLNDLKARRNLNAATHVLLTGCSAGGLSTFLHADYVGSQLPSRTIFKAFPQSGNFMPFPNFDGAPIYLDQMRYVYHMQNVSESTVNADCVRNSKDPSNCIFAPYTYSYIQTPIFIFNSFYDAWQMQNVWGVGIPGFTPCADKGPSQCTPANINEANHFANAMISQIVGNPSYRKPRNGVFLHSCWFHCGSIFDSVWTGLKIHGISVMEAVNDWWNEASGLSHRHLDCRMSEVPPYVCNPTC